MLAKGQQDPCKRKGPFKAEPGWKRAELLPGHWERTVNMQRKPRDLEMWERGGRRRVALNSDSWRRW